MKEFSVFHEKFNFPLPEISAIVSVYAQFICGFLILIGYKTRWAALIMIINFLVAIFMVHLNDTYQNTFPAIVMLACSLFLFLSGPGKPAVEKE